MYASKPLLVTSALESVDLLVCQKTPRAALEVLLRQTGVVNAVELGHRISEELENTTYDAVASRVDLDADFLLVLLDVGNLTGEDLAEGDAYPTADMHLTGTGIFEWTGDLYSTTGSNTTALFKFSPDLEEDVTLTCRTDMAGDEPVADGDTFDLFEKTAGEGNDNWFTINKSGSYTVVVDTRVMTMSVARNKSELYIVGGSVTGSNTPWGFNDKYLSTVISRNLNLES